jgi:hypothetical protein
MILRPERRSFFSVGLEAGVREDPAAVALLGLRPITNKAQRKWRLARMGNIAAMDRVAATRSASRPPSSPPTVAPAAMRPTCFLAVRGSKRSFTMDQNPETSRAPSPP